MVHVLEPAVLRLSKQLPRDTRVLDIGCGTGHLTERLHKRFSHLVAADPSSESIRIARKHAPQIDYRVASIEDMAMSGESFDLVIANMVLMDCPNLQSFAVALNAVLAPGGLLVFSITHPSYWPFYWGYFTEDWFDYSVEQAVEATFRITCEVLPMTTVHFHRPLEAYFDALCSQGLLFEKFRELVPSATSVRRYENTWRFPRFIAAAVRKPL